MDIALFEQVYTAPRNPRDRVLVALAGYTGLPVSRLLGLTYDKVFKLLKGQPFGRDVVRLLNKHGKAELKRGITPSYDVPVFTSRKQAGGARPIRRETAWRIVHAALSAVHLVGAFQVLRGMLHSPTRPTNTASLPITSMESVREALVCEAGAPVRGPPVDDFEEMCAKAREENEIARRAREAARAAAAAKRLAEADPELLAILERVNEPVSPRRAIAPVMAVRAVPSIPVSPEVFDCSFGTAGERIIEAEKPEWAKRRDRWLEIVRRYMGRDRRDATRPFTINEWAEMSENEGEVFAMTMAGLRARGLQWPPPFGCIVADPESDTE